MTILKLIIFLSYLCTHNFRLLFFICTNSVVNSNARPRRLANIATTWGPNANAIYVVHDFNEYSNGADIDKDSNTYPQNLVVPSHITVENGVERLEHVIRTIHKDVNPDFCFFVNDHTFVLPNNLCKFLKEHDSSKNLYAGHALKGQKETAFNSGAAGYVLSRSTMEKLIREWDDPNSKCAMANSSKWLQGNPGLLTAQCFGQVLHIPLIDTRDKKDLSHKFHAYGLVRTISGNIDDWYINKHKTLDDIFGVDNTYHHAPQSGSKCCSSDSISFHYVEAGESLAFWKVLQTVNESPSMTDTELQQLIEKVWPRDKEGFGGYSARLPSSQQLEVWSDILQVVRNIASGVSPSSC